MKIRRLPEAIRDVDAIWFHIAINDLEAAARVTERIANGTARLADYPASGRSRPEIGPGLRSVAIGAYLVLYRIEANSVDIVRIIHGARDVTGGLAGE